MKIGVFDSGIGGLSVLPAVRRYLPMADILYYADEKNVPYGEKSPEEILELSKKAVAFLIEKGADAIVVACNTATSVAVAALREIYESAERFVPIVGMEPAVKKALEQCPGGRVLVAATPVTVKGKKLQLLIEKYDSGRLTDTLPLPGLVRLAERGSFGEEAEQYIKGELSGLALDDYSALVLGCTHFNYFKDSFRRLIPQKMSIVDGAEGTAKRLASRISALSPKPNGGSGEIVFFSSGELVDDSPKREEFLRALRRAEIMEVLK